jgi:hypothetical protein
MTGKYAANPENTTRQISCFDALKEIKKLLLAI